MVNWQKIAVGQSLRWFESFFCGENQRRESNFLSPNLEFPTRFLVSHENFVFFRSRRCVCDAVRRLRDRIFVRKNDWISETSPSSSPTVATSHDFFVLFSSHSFVDAKPTRDFSVECYMCRVKSRKCQLMLKKVDDCLSIKYGANYIIHPFFTTHTHHIDFNLLNLKA